MPRRIKYELQDSLPRRFMCDGIGDIHCQKTRKVGSRGGLISVVNTFPSGLSRGTCRGDAKWIQAGDYKTFCPFWQLPGCLDQSDTRARRSLALQSPLSTEPAAVEPVGRSAAPGTKIPCCNIMERKCSKNSPAHVTQGDRYMTSCRLSKLGAGFLKQDKNRWTSRQ